MALEPDEFERLARQVAREVASELRQVVVDDLVLKAISQILVGFGIQEDDQKEFRADLVYLRAWRKAVQQASGAGMIAFFTLLLGGVSGALWLGFKAVLGK